MGNNEARLGATLLIWAAFTVISVVALIAQQFNIPIVVVLAGASMFATMSVWESAKKADSDEKVAEKSKRRTKVENMLAKLDERELDELRARLSDSDGEMVSLDDVLDERRRAR
ncbi:MAG: hypothetical protein JNJ61_12820 [Anaerolineae bacterium]|nr:hypothetical protein [Anaerolineae bacterium]